MRLGGPHFLQGLARKGRAFFFTDNYKKYNGHKEVFDVEFDGFWRMLFAGRPDLMPPGEEKIRLSKKQYVADLERAWYAGRGVFIGFVVYYYEVLEEVNPGLKDAEYIKFTQEAYKKALRRCYDVGQSQIPKARRKTTGEVFPLQERIH